MVDIIQLSIKVSADGSEIVESKLKRVDKASQKIDKTQKKLAKSTKKTAKAQETLGSSLRKTAQSIAVLQGPLGPIAGRITSLGAILQNGALQATAMALALTALGAAFFKSANAAGKFERQMFRINSILKTTQGRSGQTFDSINKLAISIGRETLASTQEVRDAAGQLLIFGSIADDTFERVLRLSQDLAELGFGNIRSAAQRLGRALEDPAEGITQLNTRLRIFNKEEENFIRLLAEVGNKAEAQRLILERLENTIGGAGTAAAGGLSGAFDTLGENIKLFFEEAGKLGPAEALAGFINKLSDAIVRLTERLPEIINLLKLLGDTLRTLADLALIALIAKLAVSLKSIIALIAGIGAVITPVGALILSLGGIIGVLATQLGSVSEAIKVFNIGIATLGASIQIGSNGILAFGKTLVTVFAKAVTDALRILGSFSTDLFNFLKNPFSGQKFGKELEKALSQATIDSFVTINMPTSLELAVSRSVIDVASIVPPASSTTILTN